MTINQSGWRPEAPADIDGMETPTFTGNKALMLEEPLLFEIGDLGRTGVDFEARPKAASRLGGLERNRSIGLPGDAERPLGDALDGLQAQEGHERAHAPHARDRASRLPRVDADVRDARRAVRGAASRHGGITEESPRRDPPRAADRHPRCRHQRRA